MRKSANRHGAINNVVQPLENRTLLSGISFSPAANYPVEEGPRGIAVADFNGDGKPDIVTANSYQGVGGNGSLLLNNGNGTFQAAQTIALGFDPESVAAVDLNGDGKMDIVGADFDGKIITVLLGNGNGTFQAPRTYSASGGGPYSYYPASIAVADLNGDNKPDIVTADWMASGGAVSVFLGNGNGTLQPAQTFAIGAQPQSIVVGDFNGDNKIDVAVANRNIGAAGTVSVLLGNGNGTFQSQQTLATDAEPYSLVTGDFNGDGKTDIVTANFDGNDLSLFEGNGNGTFKTQQTFDFSTGSYPVGVAAADFNGDGKTDLAVAPSSASSPVEVLLSNGNGTFQTPQTFRVEYSPRSIYATDLNGDGSPDLIVTNSGVSTRSGTVSVLLNQASSSSFATLNNGILTITGTSTADTISVTDSSGSVTAFLNGQSSAVFNSVTGVSVLPGGGSDSVSLAGVQISATVGGAGGNDTIVGGGMSDSLRGGAGADSIGGAGGDDTIVGGGDDDSIKGGAGNDELFGGPGSDTIHGGIGNDSILGGIGNDNVNGNAGDDTILAGSGSSQLFAGPGNDSIVGSTTSGDQPDSIYCGGSTDTIDAGSGDQIFDTVPGDQITGGQIA